MSAAPDPGSSHEPSSPAVLEEFIAVEIVRTRDALRRTRSAGTIIVLFVAAYMGWISISLTNFLQPDEAADLTTAFVSDQVREKTDAVALQIREKIPALIAGLPDHAFQQLPRFRERLEDRVLQDLHRHCLESSVLVGGHVDDYLRLHEADIRELLKSKDKLALDDDLKDGITDEIVEFLKETTTPDGESIQDKLDEALRVLKDVQTQAGRLAHAPDLSPQEKKTRHALAVIANTAEDQVGELQRKIKIRTLLDK